MSHAFAIEAATQVADALPRLASTANRNSIIETLFTGRRKLPGRDP